jgi:hypothetical protein
MPDRRVPGRTARDARLWICPVEGCGNEIVGATPPMCPRHVVPMVEVDRREAYRGRFADDVAARRRGRRPPSQI